MKNSFVMVIITCSTKKEALAIAGSLLKKRLVACSNIINNIGSKYWWKGKIADSCEIILICKTRGKNFKAVENEVKRLHSYEVPEIIGLPITMLSSEYRRWILDSVV